MRAYVELSGESPELARAEVAAAARALDGSAVPEADLAGTVAVELADLDAARALASRLALARRVLVGRASADGLEEAVRRAGSAGASAAFRRLGSPSGTGDRPLLDLGRVYREGGGRIDLERPERRFWLAEGAGAPAVLLEEVLAVDRAAAARRRMPLLPFQRPVALAPRLARAAANLAEVRPGDRVLDPFLGTGALLAEAGLIGARLFGIDRDATMVRGALRNLEHLGVSAESLLVGDAGAVDFGEPAPEFDAIVTDPPYGRASSTGGEPAEQLLARVLGRWTGRVAGGGRVVVIAPVGAPGPGPDWALIEAPRVRVHRSLTREFRRYGRRDGRAPLHPRSR